MCISVIYKETEYVTVAELCSQFQGLPLIKEKGYKQITGGSCLCCLNLQKMLNNAKYEFEINRMTYIVHRC